MIPLLAAASDSTLLESTLAWARTRGRVLLSIAVRGALQLLLSFIFSVEMVCRIISLGLVTEKTAYLRSSWNMLDFVVVMSIWAGAVLWLVSDADGGDETNISYLRTARALRPLRSLRFFTGIKKIMASLYDAIPMVLNVVLLIGFFFLAFSAIGEQPLADDLPRWPAFSHPCPAVFQASHSTTGRRPARALSPQHRRRQLRPWAQATNRGARLGWSRR